MFTFAWAYILLLLPLLFVVKKYFPPQRTNQDAMLRVPFLTRLDAFTQQSSLAILPNNLNQLYALCAWSLLIIACANPQWLGEPQLIHQDGRNIMLAVDLSRSMAIPDLQRDNKLINRLQSVKSVAAGFIDKRQGDKLGLILFGSKAYLQTPLTFDRKTVRSMLDDATIGLAGDHTAIGDALGLAVKKFSTENIKSRILILLTDGGNNTGVIDPMEAAELAKQQNIKIYTVGIGASQLEISNGFGTQVINPSADLDETLLKNIANKTQGQYFRAEDQTALATILDSINRLEPISSENKTARPITALFYWPLAAALFFFTLIIFPHLNERLRR
ncbi:MAG: vWA domain-containing protein [Gammaproteobacteria bacterium]